MTASTAPHVTEPQWPLHQCTTFELTAYRDQLENAIAYFDQQEHVPAVRHDLQVKLDLVLAEQDSRAKFSHA